MDKTDCLELTFPECDPPLTKDASDIIQFQTLALETDAAVQALDDVLTDTLLSPDAVIMVGGTNAAGLDVTHFYASAPVYDPAGMANTTLDLIEIQEDGWYMIGGWVRCTGSGIIGLRVEPLVNGETISSRQGPGFVNFGSESVTWTDAAFMREGDLLNCMTHHTDNPVTVRTYATQIWALQILINV